MRPSPFPRLVLAALGSAVVFSAPVVLTGCGGSSNGQAEVVVPKQPLTSAYKDSMNDYLKSQAHAQAQRKVGRR
jgi:hypothetical protein